MIAEGFEEFVDNMLKNKNNKLKSDKIVIENW